MDQREQLEVGGRVEAVLPYVGYLVVGVLSHLPALASGGRALAGDGWDARMFLWFLWHTGSSLGSLSWPLWTCQLMAPEGVSLAQQSHVFLVGALAAPVQWLAGPVVAYNLAMVASMVLAGVAAHLLLRRRGHDPWVAYAAAVIFTCGQIRVGQSVFLNISQSFWLPLVLWAAMGARSRQRLRESLLAGAVVGGAVLTSYNVAVLALTLLVFMGAAGALGPLVPGDGRRRWAAFLGAALVVASPVLAALAADLVREGWYVSLPADLYGEPTDLVNFVANWTWGVPGPSGAIFEARQAAYLGAVTMVLGVLGLGAAFGRRDVRRVALLALVFFLLSLGPELVVAGHRTGIALPGRLLAGVPLLREVRIPIRWALPFWTLWSLLVAHGVAAVASLASGRGRLARAAVAVGLAFVAASESGRVPLGLCTPLPSTPPIIDAIAADPRDGLVLEVMGGRFGYSGYSWFQIRHGRPVLEGQLSRVPPSARERVDASPLLRPFRRVVLGQGLVPPLGSSAARAMAAEARRLRVRWVMIPMVRDQRFTPASPELLLRLDRMVRQCLPVRCVAHELTAEVEAAERALLARTWTPEHCGGSYLWRVYELDLPERR